MSLFKKQNKTKYEENTKKETEIVKPELSEKEKLRNELKAQRALLANLGQRQKNLYNFYLCLDKLDMDPTVYQMSEANSNVYLNMMTIIDDYADHRDEDYKEIIVKFFKEFLQPLIENHLESTEQEMHICTSKIDDLDSKLNNDCSPCE